MLNHFCLFSLYLHLVEQFLPQTSSCIICQLLLDLRLRRLPLPPLCHNFLVSKFPLFYLYWVFRRRRKKKPISSVQSFYLFFMSSILFLLDIRVKNEYVREHVRLWIQQTLTEHLQCAQSCLSLGDRGIRKIELLPSRNLQYFGKDQGQGNKKLWHWLPSLRNKQGCQLTLGVSCFSYLGGTSFLKSKKEIKSKVY